MNTYVITMFFSKDNTDDVIKFRSELENYIDTPEITAHFQYLMPNVIAFKTDKPMQPLVTLLNSLNLFHFVIFKTDTVIKNSEHPDFGLDRLGFVTED